MLLASALEASEAGSRLGPMYSDDDEPLGELAELEGADELCRRLLVSPWSFGRSTRHMEALELLANAHGTGELSMSFVAFMLCACGRWDRVTARLIAAIEDSGLLGDDELDELADWFLAHEHVISYPLAWASPQWLDVEFDGGKGRTYTVSADTLAEHRPSFEPPLRRWGARRALSSDPTRLEQLLDGADLFEARHRDAFIHGLLDAAQLLDEDRRRGVIERGLRTGQATVRRTALDQSEPQAPPFRAGSRR